MMTMDNHLQPSPFASGMPKLISVSEFCELVGIGRTKAHAEMKAGEIAYIKIGRRTLIELAEVYRYIERRRRGGSRS
jgi:excisionase family DNA binding protein